MLQSVRARNGTRAMTDAIRIHITEVGPRDGLQNETAILDTSAKIALVDTLSASGLREIETSSFVRPDVVPQLADAMEVFAGITRAKDVIYSALVPNMKGFHRALEAGAMKVCVFTAVTETFCQRNINATFEESLNRFAPVIQESAQAGIPVRAYLSCIVRCPYEGPVAPEVVRESVARLCALGDVEIALGETLGVAQPEEIEAVIDATGDVVAPSEMVLHLHDTKGRAIQSVDRAVQMGVRSFDTACGGLGGCPFADGAPGNLATERLLAYAGEVGWHTGVDVSVVRDAASAVAAALGPKRDEASDSASRTIEGSS